MRKGRRSPRARLVVADARDQAHRLSDRGAPGAEIGGLTAAAQRDRGGGVVVGLQRALEEDADVLHQVPDGNNHRSRLLQLRYAEFIQLRLAKPTGGAK